LEVLFKFAVSSSFFLRSSSTLENRTEQNRTEDDHYVLALLRETEQDDTESIELKREREREKERERA
jgi:hypothetical protein